MAGNSYLRVHAVTVDELGIDPLLDTLVPEIIKIGTYTNHVVTSDERCAPDAIAYKYYSSEDLWWVILTYNGIGMYSDLVEGLSIKIPDPSTVTQVIGQSSIRDTNVQRVITI